MFSNWQDQKKIFYAICWHKQPPDDQTIFNIKCDYNSESYESHIICGTKSEGGHNLIFLLGSFFNKR